MNSAPENRIVYFLQLCKMIDSKEIRLADLRACGEFPPYVKDMEIMNGMGLPLPTQFSVCTKPIESISDARNPCNQGGHMLCIAEVKPDQFSISHIGPDVLRIKFDGLKDLEVLSAGNASSVAIIEEDEIVCQASIRSTPYVVRQDYLDLGGFWVQFPHVYQPKSFEERLLKLHDKMGLRL